MKKTNKKIYRFTKKRYKEIKEIIDKRYNILVLIIISIVIVLFTSLFYLQIIKKDYYTEKVNNLALRTILGGTAPRGRIYDRNGKLIVDNKPNKIISYKKPLGITAKLEIETAYKVADLIDVSYRNLTERQLKNFWIRQNPALANEKITQEEWDLLKSRKLTTSDINRYKFDRVSETDLSVYDDIDKEAAYIYYLMNIGYSFSEKVIKKSNISEEEYALISENEHLLIGFTTRLDWNREYLYGSTLRSVLGNVSTTEQGIPFEYKDYYLGLGYALNDRVGISGIEYQYENYLVGQKDHFQLMKDGSLNLTKEGSKGNDLYLTIDIDLQYAVEKIIEEELIKAKKEPNTEYLDKTFVIISDPTNGEIIAMAGKQIKEINGEYIFYDYTPGVYTYSVVPGSSVKGASHIVGYNNNALMIGEKRDDACIKIASTPIKCSYRYSGVINDITALKVSSNVYQFHTAIKVGKANYIYNGPLSIDKNAFSIYRNTFKEFGLGIKSDIDLPNEGLGYSGSSTLSGHLLDFSIGQYDTYTPIQLSQYINTIANNGIRVKPHLLKEVRNNNNIKVFETNINILGVVNTKEEYLKRVQEGFKEVMLPSGTGYGLIELRHIPAGKTGTSESFLDTTGDGKIDTQTISNVFVGYAPFDEPKVSFTVVSPDVTHPNTKINYTSSINRRVSREIGKKFFEIYE